MEALLLTNFFLLTVTPPPLCFFETTIPRSRWSTPSLQDGLPWKQKCQFLGWELRKQDCDWWRGLFACFLFVFVHLLYIFLFLSSVLHFFSCIRVQSLCMVFFFHTILFFMMLLFSPPPPSPQTPSLTSYPCILIRQKGTFQSAASASRCVGLLMSFQGNPWVLMSGQCHVRYRYETGEASLDTGGVLGLFLRSQEVSRLLGLKTATHAEVPT